MSEGLRGKRFQWDLRQGRHPRARPLLLLLSATDVRGRAELDGESGEDSERVLVFSEHDAQSHRRH